MNFYYFMVLGCPLHESFAPLQFIERLGLPFAIQRSDRACGIDPENPAEADQARPVKVRLDGAEQLMPRSAVRDLYNEFLGTARSHCMHCPVNKTSSPYGCVGIVPLPLSAKAEKWLFEQFAPPEPDKSYFLQQLRLGRLPTRRHEMLLTSSVEFKKQPVAGQPEVTSTQIFYYLLNVREPGAEQRLRLLYEFGAIKARPRDVDDLSILFAEATAAGTPLAASPAMEQARRIIDRFKVRIKYEKADDESIGALKQYFLFSLQSLNAGIRMVASLM